MNRQRERERERKIWLSHMTTMLYVCNVLVWLGGNFGN